jgi:hypothetical protein
MTKWLRYTMLCADHSEIRRIDLELSWLAFTSFDYTSRLTVSSATSVSCRQEAFLTHNLDELNNVQGWCNRHTAGLSSETYRYDTHELDGAGRSVPATGPRVA